jgi:DNA-binding transcriptional LysR family regulator
MSLGPLRAFVETVRAGSIRKASEVLRVAPSSVSRHIAILENEMGTALFIRRADATIDVCDRAFHRIDPAKRNPIMRSR